VDTGFFGVARVAEDIAHVVLLGPHAIRAGEILTGNEDLHPMLILADNPLRLHLPNLYLKEDRYEITSLYGHGNIDYSLYGMGTAAGDAGLKLPLDQTGQVFRAEFLRVIKWKIFVGGRFWTGDSIVTVKPNQGDTAPVPPDVELYTTLRALGVGVIRDTRPNQFYPTAGMKAEFTSDFFAKDLGSKYSFQSYRVTFTSTQP
jgi:hypothetical protein